MARIIVVEDDAELNRTVCSYLGLRGQNQTKLTDTFVWSEGARG